MEVVIFNYLIGRLSYDWYDFCFLKDDDPVKGNVRVCKCIYFLFPDGNNELASDVKVFGLCDYLCKVFFLLMIWYL